VQLAADADAVPPSWPHPHSSGAINCYALAQLTVLWLTCPPLCLLSLGARQGITVGVLEAEALRDLLQERVAAAGADLPAALDGMPNVREQGRRWRAGQLACMRVSLHVPSDPAKLRAYSRRRPSS
jgi:hypothetical protein